MVSCPRMARSRAVLHGLYIPTERRMRTRISVREASGAQGPGLPRRWLESKCDPHRMLPRTRL